MSGYYLPGRKLMKVLLLDMYNRDTPADVDAMLDALEHVSSLFPSNTNLTCTLTANATANTYDSWIEIADSASATFSSVVASHDGHITSVVFESLSEDNTIYMFEIAYGSDKVVRYRGRFAGANKFQTPTTVKRFWAPPIPAGETVYYRMKTATAVADYCNIHFRYHLHD